MKIGDLVISPWVDLRFIKVIKEVSGNKVRTWIRYDLLYNNFYFENSPINVGRHPGFRDDITAYRHLLPEDFSEEIVAKAKEIL